MVGHNDHCINAKRMRRFDMVYRRFQYGNIIHQQSTFAFGEVNRKRNKSLPVISLVDIA